jgi:hypothetical protein
LSFFASLAAVGAVLAATVLAGWVISLALLPTGSIWRAERWGWSLPLGAAILAAATAAALALDVRPGWPSFLSTAAVAGVIAWRLRLARGHADGPASTRRSPFIALCLSLLLVTGIALYLLRALTEPMWSNDYLAIWGLKAKTIFFAHALPPRVLPERLYGFSHPEYPLGLPLLFAGIASVLGRWEDHATALFFPAFQVATLAVLWGWLRRRGVRWPLPLAAAVLLSLFEPLYSGFLTGLAEVPLSCIFLLFGLALSDSLDANGSGAQTDGDDSGAARRLATASLLAGGLKNEGLLIAVLGASGALIAPSPRRWRTAACALLPAGAIAMSSRVLNGNAPLRDFDFGLIARPAELPARLFETVRAGVSDVLWPAAAGLLCVLVLFAAGRRTPFADRLLWLAGGLWAAYLLIPMFAVSSPAWLVATSLARTSAALAPLAAAGLTARLRRETADESSAASGDPKASEGRAAAPKPSIPAS